MWSVLVGALQAILRFIIRAAFFSVGLMVLNYLWQRVNGHAEDRSGRRGAEQGQPEQQPNATAPSSEEDEAILKEIFEGWMAKAEAGRVALGDKKMTVEHLVLAMAQDARFGKLRAMARSLCNISMDCNCYSDACHGVPAGGKPAATHPCHASCPCSAAGILYYIFNS